MCNTIDISKLDKKNNKTDWVSSAKHNKQVEFNYNGVNGMFVIQSYSHATRKCNICYNNKIYTLPTSSILHCRLGNLFKTDKVKCSSSPCKIKDDTKHIYYLYCHKNIYNGKMYFGITRNNPERRWNKGKGYYNNKYFTRAIKKYGWDEGFTHEIIFDGLTQKAASEREKYYIKKYKTNNRNYGYNIAVGGIDEMIGSENPNAREIYQYALNGNFIKKWDCIKDAGVSIGVYNTGNIQRALKTKTHMAYNFLWTNFYADKITAYDMPQKIYQYSLNGYLINIYNNTSCLPCEYNYNKVNECCKHKSFTYKKCIWLFENDIENIMLYVRLNKYAKYSKKPVIQYDLNGTPISTFVSIYEASAITGIDSQLIYKNCIGEIKTTHYKYRWEYIEYDKLYPEIMKLQIKDE